ncbi:MAG TPA: hypothetical protein VNV66_04335 [Pilimelia sp.]|nr:hypothetical protein [Pilimelia sp.]
MPSPTLTTDRDHGPEAPLRLPRPDDPAPRSGRMVAICGWAALLALVGLAVGARALFAVASGAAPDWYEPTVVTVGAVGAALTAAAFLAVQRTRLPFLLLAAATVPLVANLVISAVAL